MLRRAAAIGALALLLAPVSAAHADIPQPYVVALEPGTTDATADAVAAHAGVKAVQHYHGASAGMAASMTSAQVAAIAAQPDVLFVEPDIPIAAAGKAPPPPPAEVTPPGVKRVGGARGASGAAVAILDTGIASTTELNMRAGTNCITAGAAPIDDNGHGTNVAGIVGARANGAATIGVAPATPLYAVKVLSSRGTGTLSQLLCGLDWVTAHARDLGIRVVNMSIAAAGTDDGACGSVNGDALHRSVCALTAAGVLVVAAAGNATTGLEKTVPAAYGEVLTATAMTDTDGLPGATGPASCASSDVDDRYASFSNYATTSATQAHTVAAPGVCVLSTGYKTATSTYSGTSQAAPHVAAAAALCIDDAGIPGPCAGLTPAGVISRLRTDALSGAAGFLGDPMRPITGRYYGPLISAATY